MVGILGCCWRVRGVRVRTVDGSFKFNLKYSFVKVFTDVDSGNVNYFLSKVLPCEVVLTVADNSKRPLS